MQLLDVVMLTADIPTEGLLRGQLGTIVELLDHKHGLLEFVGDDGQTIATVPIALDQLLSAGD